MCDFHSTIWRENEMFHDPGNSHSEMVKLAGWRENEQNRKPFYFEAEWNGKGKFTDKNIRNAEECPESLKKKIHEHYRKLKECLETGKYLKDYFYDYGKYRDVYANVKALPEGFKFPKIDGNLYLNHLTSLKNIQFPKIGGSLDLRRLTRLPNPPKAGGRIYLKNKKI